MFHTYRTTSNTYKTQAYMITNLFKPCTSVGVASGTRVYPSVCSLEYESASCSSLRRKAHLSLFLQPRKITTTCSDPLKREEIKDVSTICKETQPPKGPGRCVSFARRVSFHFVNSLPCTQTETRVQGKPGVTCLARSNLNIFKGESSCLGLHSFQKRYLCMREKIVDTMEKASLPLENKSRAGELFSIDQIKQGESPWQILSEEIIEKDLKKRKNLLSVKSKGQYTHSFFKRRLQERKKIRVLYGNLSSKALDRYLKQTRKPQELIAILESRLDVVLKRASFFSSIQSSRQSILHGEITINRTKVFSPAIQCKPGDLIQVVQKQEGKEFSKRTNTDYSFSTCTDSLHRIAYKKRQSIDTRGSSLPQANFDSDIDIRIENRYSNFSSIRTNRLPLNKVYRSLRIISLLFYSSLLAKNNLCPYFSFKRQRENSKVMRSHPALLLGVASSTKPAFSNRGSWSFKRTKVYLGERSGLFSSFKQQKEDAYFTCKEPRTVLAHQKDALVVYPKKESSPEKNRQATQKGGQSYSPFLRSLNSKQHDAASSFFFRKDNKRVSNTKENPRNNIGQATRSVRKTDSISLLPLHLEISHRNLSLIFLYPPQRVCMPVCIDLHAI